MEQGRLQSAESVNIERRLRRLKIIPLAHSSDRTDVLAHSIAQACCTAPLKTLQNFRPANFFLAMRGDTSAG
jgi:hypothetical protein